MIGRENVETVRDISDFSDRWTVGSLQGKLLVACLDLPNGPLPPSAVGIIKQFVGDDPIKGEKKYRNSFTFFRKPLVLLAGNHPICLRNMAEEDAMLNRMVCILFKNPVLLTEQHQQLYKELLAEAPYIIREAIGVFQKLAQRNFNVTRSVLPDEFQPEEGCQILRGVQQYVQEFLAFDPNSECTTEDLWNDYSDICMVYHVPQPSKIVFSRALTQVLSSMNALVEPVKRACGTESRGYKGITILER